VCAPRLWHFHTPPLASAAQGEGQQAASDASEAWQPSAEDQVRSTLHMSARERGQFLPDVALPLSSPCVIHVQAEPGGEGGDRRSRRYASWRRNGLQTRQVSPALICLQYSNVNSCTSPSVIAPPPYRHTATTCTLWHALTQAWHVLPPALDPSSLTYSRRPLQLPIALSCRSTRCARQRLQTAGLLPKQRRLTTCASVEELARQVDELGAKLHDLDVRCAGGQGHTPDHPILNLIRSRMAAG
jgi:hypothetical protein